MVKKIFKQKDEGYRADLLIAVADGELKKKNLRATEKLGMLNTMASENYGKPITKKWSAREGTNGVVLVRKNKKGKTQRKYYSDEQIRKITKYK